jgi:hypothetical protein
MARARREWTREQDSRIRQLRAEGADWPAVGHAFGFPTEACRRRGVKLGLARKSTGGAGAVERLATREPPEAESDGFDRRDGALPPGHPITWGAITSSTMLDGQPYGSASPLS